MNAQVLLQKLETAAATVGLTINQSKTKAMIIGDKSTGEQILLKTWDIEIVDDFCYSHIEQRHQYSQSSGLDSD